MVNSAMFGKALRALTQSVGCGADVTDEQLAKLVKGTNLKPTSRVMDTVRWAVDFEKSDLAIMDGAVVEVPKEHRDSVRGNFFLVHLTGWTYRVASITSHDDWLDFVRYFTPTPEQKALQEAFVKSRVV